jgi:hypothetical protein
MTTKNLRLRRRFFITPLFKRRGGGQGQALPLRLPVLALMPEIQRLIAHVWYDTAMFIIFVFITIEAPYCKED